MRITLNLPDDLLREMRQRAARSGWSFTAVIEDALRESLARRGAQTAALAPNLSTWGRGGLQPGVDLDDTAALFDVMEGQIPDQPARPAKTKQPST